MNNNEYTFTPEELSDTAKINAMVDNYFNNRDTSLAPELSETELINTDVIKNSATVTIRRMLETKKRAIADVLKSSIKDIKETIANENRDLIETIMPYDDFVNSNAVYKSEDGNAVAIYGTDISFNKNNVETTEQFGILNQVYNEISKETAELRMNYSNLNKEAYQQSFASEYMSVYDGFDTIVNSNENSINDAQKELANKIIFNLDSFKVENDVFTGVVDGQTIVIDQENNSELYEAVQSSYFYYEMSDLVLSELNTPKGVFHVDINNLKNNNIVEKGSTPIKVKSADINNMTAEHDVAVMDNIIAELLASDNNVEPVIDEELSNIETNEEIDEQKTASSEIDDPLKSEKNDSEYREARTKINNQKDLTPKKRAAKITALHNKMELAGKLTLGNKVFDFLVADRVEPILFKAGYSSMKFAKKVKHLIDGSVISYWVEKKNTRDLINAQKEKDNEPSTDEEEIVETKEEVALEPAIEEIALEPAIVTEPVTKEEVITFKTPEEKYNNLLDNTCKNLDSKNLSPEDLKKELSLLGLTDMDYRESKTRVADKARADKRSEKYVNEFKNELHSKINETIEKDIFNANEKLKEDLMVMKNQLEEVKNLSNVHASEYTEELDKLYVSTPTVTRSEQLPENFVNDFNQLLNNDETISNKSR